MKRFYLSLLLLLLRLKRLQQQQKLLSIKVFLELAEEAKKVLRKRN